MSIFNKLHKQGRSIIIVTHDLAVAEHAQRIILMKDGQIAEDYNVKKRCDPDAELSVLASEEKAS